MKMTKDVKFVHLSYPWINNDGDSIMADDFPTKCPHYSYMRVGDVRCIRCPFFGSADFTNNIVKCSYNKIELMKQDLKNKPDYVLIGIILGVIAFWGGLVGLLCIFF